MKLTAWEYRVHQVKISELGTTLNALGRNGWELVSMLRESTVFVDVVLKRPAVVRA